MDLTLWRHQGGKTVHTGLNSIQGRRGYDQHVALLDHPIVNYYRVTLSDPLAGNRIVADSDTERLA